MGIIIANLSMTVKINHKDAKSIKDETNQVFPGPAANLPRWYGSEFPRLAMKEIIGVTLTICIAVAMA